MNTDINTTYENDQKRIKQIISDEINPINHKEIFQYPISLLEKTHETDFQSCYETLSWANINKLNLSNRIEDYAQTVYIQAIKNKPIYQININRDLLQLGNTILFLSLLNLFLSTLSYTFYFKNRNNKRHNLCKEI